MRSMTSLHSPLRAGSTVLMLIRGFETLFFKPDPGKIHVHAESEPRGLCLLLEPRTLRIEHTNENRKSGSCSENMLCELLPNEPRDVIDAQGEHIRNCVSFS